MPPQSKKLKSFYDRSPVWVQNLMSSGYGLATVTKLSFSPFRRLTRELVQSQWLSTEQLREIQFARLQKMLCFAYANVPYYRRSFEQAGVHPQDLKQIEDVGDLPLLQKEALRNEPDSLLPPNTDRKALTLVITSGTTGSPLGVYWDQAAWRASRAAIARCRGWARYQLGRSIATFTGIVVVPRGQTKPPFWRYDLPENRTLFSLFHLSQENLRFYINELKRIRPEFIEGYPSVLFILAQYLEFVDDYLPVKAIFSGSEPLYADHREVIERRFQTRVYDYYGLAEGVASAGQCEKLDGYHVTMENVVVEVINEKGRPVEPGESGEIVGTSLVNFVMPLIRYRTGDISLHNANTCECGRGLALIGQIVTKSEDIITTPEGQFIPPSVLTHPFKPIHTIEKSQIVQVSLDHVVVKIVRRPGYSDEDSARLLVALQERLGSKIHVDLEFVEDIPRTGVGKYRFVVSTVPFRMP